MIAFRRLKIFGLHRLIRPWTLGLIFCLGVLALPISASAQTSIDGVSILFDWSLIKPGSGTLASFVYNPLTDTYHVSTNGNFAGVHTLKRNTTTDPYAPNVSIEIGTDAFPSDVLRFYRSTDVPAGGTNTAYGGSPFLFGIVLNPTELTIEVPEADPITGLPTGNMTSLTYQPGQLAYITDGGGTLVDNRGTTTTSDDVSYFGSTKKMYRWDLRSIGSPTTQQPDFSTGTSGASPGHNPDGPDPGTVPDYGALGQADWNDVFTVVTTSADLHQAYANFTSTTDTSAPNFGRQPAFSTDGKYLYSALIGALGGLYKINAANGDTTMLAQGTYISDVAVLATPGGDKVLFGPSSGANAGAISYVLDSGSGTSAAQPLYEPIDFSTYAGKAPSNVMSIATDSAGNIYFADGTQGIHAYDSQGRFRSVLNLAQIFEVNFNHDGARANAGGTLRLQVREDTGETYLMFRGDNKYAAAVRVFDGGDVNRDGVVNSDDKTFFMAQYNKTFHTTKPNPAGGVGTRADYINYINADLNGDINPLANVANPGYATTNTGAVNNLDRLVIAQFIDLALGDFNWDGNALSPEDWAIFNAHFDVAPSAFGWNQYGWFDGDVSGPSGTPDGLVNQFDLNFLLANVTAIPEPTSLASLAVMLSVFAFCVWRRQRRRNTN